MLPHTYGTENVRSLHVWSCLFRTGQLLHRHAQHRLAQRQPRAHDGAQRRARLCCRQRPLGHLRVPEINTSSKRWLLKPHLPQDAQPSRHKSLIEDTPVQQMKAIKTLLYHAKICFQHARQSSTCQPPFLCYHLAADAAGRVAWVQRPSSKSCSKRSTGMTV